MQMLPYVTLVIRHFFGFADQPFGSPECHNNDSARARKGEHPTREELLAVLSIMIGFFVTLIILSIIFMTIGVSFLDSVFEVGSALTTNGISMGATVVTMPIGYKWLMTFAMVIGRVEIVSISAAIVGRPMAKRLGNILKKAIRR